MIVVPDAAGAPPEALDLAFVVDATGSMGDEIHYLQAEIENIAVRVAAEHPGVSTRFGLVMYRDVGDDYVTRVYDFSSLASFHDHLLQQSAGGGGDYPEAAERGMQDATNRLLWRHRQRRARAVPGSRRAAATRQLVGIPSRCARRPCEGNPHLPGRREWCRHRGRVPDALVRTRHSRSLPVPHG